MKKIIATATSFDHQSYFRILMNDIKFSKRSALKAI